LDRNSLPAGFDPAIVGRIDALLRDVVRQENVTLLLAIESGSRAWGFPSPDSDYDCRFIYARRPDDYLSLFPARDVIEAAQDAVLDVNGWDLAKALRLLLKGNAVVIEWLTSPYAYAESSEFRAEGLALAREVVHPAAVARHYLHLGRRQRRTYFADEKSIALKKIFYALRPAVALRWLRLHPGIAVAPMHFPTLIAECDLPAKVRAIVDELLARKAETRELGRGPLPAPVRELIDGEFALAEAREGPTIPVSDDARAAADPFFRRWVGA
jgi:predicted nucleotidyltransferase